MASMKQNVTPSKRFIIVSIFVGLTISALCNSIFNIIYSYDSSKTLDSTILLYWASLMMFVIKYFVDDIIDDKDDVETDTQKNLAMIVVAWTSFLLAAFFLKNMFASSILWTLGLIVVTILLNRDKKHKKLKYYAWQNIILIVILEFLIFFTCDVSFITRLYNSLKTPWPSPTYILTIILILFNAFYIVLSFFCKNKAHPKTSDSNTSPDTVKLSVSMNVNKKQLQKNMSFINKLTLGAIRRIPYEAKKRLKKDINKDIKDYGEVTALSLDLKKKKIYAKILLAGEEEPIDVDIQGYELSDDEDSYVLINTYELNKQWMTALADQFLCERELPIPKDKFALVKSILV